MPCTIKKIVFLILLFLIIILSFIGGQVYSKYVSKVKGEGIAEISTWNFKINTNNEQIQKIDLKPTYTNGDRADKIEPGTKGDFNIIIDTDNSDVDIRCNINFCNEKNKPQNLKFIYENIEYNSITELTNVLSNTIFSKEEKTKTFNIKWEWKYETGNTNEEITKNDEKDTKDMETIDKFTFDIIVSGTQIDTSTNKK